MKKLVQIAILDLNNGYPNQGLRGIRRQVENFIEHSPQYQIYYDIFDVRPDGEIPDILDYDIFISSGGPGSPLEQGDEWEQLYYDFLDGILDYNRWNKNKKYLFLICHSFQMACAHWQLATVTKRKSYSFGVLPVHRTEEGKKEFLFEGLADPFYVVDSRAFQVIEPNESRMKEMGATILNLEKDRPHVDLERAIMSIRFTDEVFGTQYHPEADAEGMRKNFMLEERRKQLIDTHGKDKYEMTIRQLYDPDKILLTHSIILPRFLESSASNIRIPSMVS